MGNNNEESSSFLTDEEKESLLKGIQEIQQEQTEEEIGTKLPKNNN
jgi:hypothetical protein